MERRLVIWGASGHAMVVADVVRSQAMYEIIGFLDDVNTERHGMQFQGAMILGGQEQLAILSELGVKYLLFGFGDCKARLRLADVVRKSGFSLAKALHPRATVADDVTVGDGTVIMAGAIINSGTQIGDNVVVSAGATIDHECSIADGALIAPGVHLAGNVQVGRGCWIGLGALIKEQIHIGEGSIIGAGSLVLKNIPSGVIAYGVPARVVKEAAS